MEQDEEKCERCGLPTPSSELELWDGLCCVCAGMGMAEMGKGKGMCGLDFVKEKQRNKGKLSLKETQSVVRFINKVKREKERTGV